MANRIVGKLGIKIMPDLTSFRADLKAQLQEIQKSTTAEIKANMNLDKTKFLADVKAATEEAKLEIENLKTKTTIKVNLDANTAAFLTRVKSALNEVEKGNNKIPFTPELTKFKAEVQAEVDKIRLTMKAKIPTTPDGLEKYRAELEAQVKAASARVRAKIKTDVDTSQLKDFRTAFGLLATGLKGAEALFGDVSAGAQTLAGGLSDAVDEGKTFADNFSELGSKLSNFGQVASSVGIALLGMIGPGVVGAIVEGVGAIETAILAIPALIGDAALAGGALYVVFKGIPSLIQAGFGANSQKELDAFHKQLSNQAPAVQSFVNQLLAIKPELKGFRTELQQDFFSGFDSGIKTLITNTLPEVRTTMDSIVTSMGNAIGETVKWANSPSGRTKISDFLVSVEGVFQELAPIMKPVVDMFTTLGTMANNDLIKPLVMDITNAATQADKFFNSGSGQTTLKGAFENLKSLVEGIAKPVGNLGKDILQAFGSKTSKDAIKKFSKALDDFEKNIGPQLPGLIKNFGDLATSITELLTALGPTLPIILGATATGLDLVALALAGFNFSISPNNPIITFFKKDLPDAVSGFAKRFPDLSQQIGTVIANFGLGLYADGQAWANNLVKGVVDWLTSNGKSTLQGNFNANILQPVLDLGARIYAAGNGLANNLIAGIISQSNRALTAGVTFGNNLQNGIASRAASVYASANGVANRAISAFLSWAGRALSAGFTFSVNLGSGILGRAASVYSAANGIANRAIGALSRMGAEAYSIGQSVVEGIVSGIEAGFGWVISAAENLAHNAISAAKGALHINSPSKIFIEIGKGVGEGFVMGINAGQDNTWRASQDLASVAITAAESVANNGVAWTAPPGALTPHPGLGDIQGSANGSDRPIVLNVDGKKLAFATLGGDRANQKRG